MGSKDCFKKKSLNKTASDYTPTQIGAAIGGTSAVSSLAAAIAAHRAKSKLLAAGIDEEDAEDIVSPKGALVRGFLKPIVYGSFASKVLGAPVKYINEEYDPEAALYAAGSLYGIYDSYKKENKRVKDIIKSHKQDKILKDILKKVSTPSV